MIETSKAKRIVGLLVVLVAAVMVLSGPVSQVLELPEPTAQAKKKHKKKKKKKNSPSAFNVVNCAEVGFTCNGTAGSDFLVGTPGSENILGGEGNDVYQANGGNTFLIDSSVRSNDSYTALDPGDGRNTVIFDDGGSADSLDMSSFRVLDDIKFIRLNNGAPGAGDNLILAFERPGGGVVNINEYFGAGRIETIRFANGTLTGQQAGSLARQATPEEQTAMEENLDEAQLRERLPEEERTSQDEGASQKEE